ncbi:MAG: NAD-dependent epimerase/dehydratase family protein [Sediminibacterium sp.]|nr:NAD-dependent epimerase/dehydratase family protein [Sediminibacterium sp.]
MNILLTGASGFLGKFIKTYFQIDNKVETLGRDVSCKYVCNLANEVPNFHNEFDVVIHAAGKAHVVPNSTAEADEFYIVNYKGTLNLLSALEHQHLKSFVFISSASVYGLEQGNNISELSPLIATDPYGKSKIEAEQIVQEWCNNHSVRCTILRLPLVVGTNPPGNLGNLIEGIKKGYYFNIGGGEAKKSMVLATDVAKFILKAAQIGGTYNLTDGYHPNFNELSNLIAKHLGKNKVKNIPNFIAKSIAKVGDVFGSRAPLNSDKFKKITSTLTFDDSKARAAFGWNPTPVLEGFKIHDDL